MLLVKLRKRCLCKRLLRYENETQKSWKPLLNTIFDLRGSFSCLAQGVRTNSFAQFYIYSFHLGLLIPYSIFI